MLPHTRSSSLVAWSIPGDDTLCPSFSLRLAEVLRFPPWARVAWKALARLSPAAAADDPSGQISTGVAAETVPMDSPFPFSNGKTIIVDAYGGGDAVDLEQAVQQAEPGTKIIVRPGQYKSNLVIDKSLEILGDGDHELIQIDGYFPDERYSIIDVRAPEVRISGLSISAHCRQSGYGIIENRYGKLVLENCCVRLSGRGFCIAIREHAKAIIAGNKITTEGCEEYDLCVYIEGDNISHVIYNEIAGGCCCVRVEGPSLVKHNIIKNFDCCGIYIFIGYEHIIQYNRIFISGHRKIFFDSSLCEWSLYRDVFKFKEKISGRNSEAHVVPYAGIGFSIAVDKEDMQPYRVTGNKFINKKGNWLKRILQIL